jgi:hypothetical protein
LATEIDRTLATRGGDAQVERSAADLAHSVGEAPHTLVDLLGVSAQNGRRRKRCPSPSRSASGKNVRPSARTRRPQDETPIGDQNRTPRLDRVSILEHAADSGNAR